MTRVRDDEASGAACRDRADAPVTQVKCVDCESWKAYAKLRNRRNCATIGSRRKAHMVEWRSGSAGALQAQGRGFKSLLDHHESPGPGNGAFPFAGEAHGFEPRESPAAQWAAGARALRQRGAGPRMRAAHAPKSLLDHHESPGPGNGDFFYRSWSFFDVTPSPSHAKA